MYFVDYMHKNDIAVILDWVPAHFPRDAFGLGNFDGQPLYEHPDKRRGEHPHWGTLIFNYAKREVENFLLANGLFWVKKFPENSSLCSLFLQPVRNGARTNSRTLRISDSIRT